MGNLINSVAAVDFTLFIINLKLKSALFLKSGIEINSNQRKDFFKFKALI